MEGTKDDASAVFRAAIEVNLASKMAVKADLLLNAITPEAIAQAIAAGKMRDVAASVEILLKRRQAIQEDLKDRLGVDHLKSPKDVDTLIKSISAGMKQVENHIHRQQALGRATPAQFVEDESD